MKFSWLGSLTALFMTVSASAEANADVCQLFRVYPKADLPPRFDEESPEPLTSPRSESELVRAIASRLPGQRFEPLYLQSPWATDEPETRLTFLRCLFHYVRMDHSHDGIADWTPVVDGAVSEILLPNQNDIDGDGVENLFDSAMLDPKRGSTERGAKDKIPPHLRVAHAKEEQDALFREFGLIAVDHSDQHAPHALRELLMVLREGLPPGARPPKNLKVIYAFKGHDGRADIAAFHRQAGALSIGGSFAYGFLQLTPEDRVRVASAFAHEIGHAVLFARLTPTELREIGVKFGHWKAPSGEPGALGLSSSVFLTPHPLHELMSLGERTRDQSQDFIRLSLWSKTNLTSEYAATNLHEWFADAFAASVLHRLGERGRFGPEWRKLLTRLPDRSGGYWVNYNNLSPEFRRWIDRRFGFR